VLNDQPPLRIPPSAERIYQTKASARIQTIGVRIDAASYARKPRYVTGPAAILTFGG
jgi:hypothetical protein